ncbi:MAG: Formyl-CoA transferase [Atribacteria bacterium 34_128]|nr:MAG: Formyl-CoA transferase [Atribacteria bacterium 34_128]HBY56873.1 carnitine dehydratase [Candidatus Atribacteria bacterium]
MTKPLEGIRVLDLGHVLAMPTCTMQLADLGAEVIKIERPGSGDDSRYFGPFVHGESAYFMSINRNKKSLTLDLKQEEGKEIFKELVKKSDVVTENFRPNTMEKLGLGYHDLKKINPKIIYASICGFGHYSVDQQRPGYDIIAQASGGIMAITGYPDGPPTRVGSSIGDIFSGSFATIAILAALRYRDITGEGQEIDISMMDSVLSVLENAVVRYTVTGEIPTRIGSRHPSIAPFDLFEAKDGWVVIAVGNDSLWGKFCKIIHQEKLINDPLYQTNDLRSKNYDQLKPLITSWTKQQFSEKMVALLTKEGVPAAEVSTMDKIVRDPNIKMRNMLIQMDHPKAGKVTVANSPIRLSKCPNDTIDASPILGEHTEKVLEGVLEMSQEEIRKLKDKKVV